MSAELWGNDEGLDPTGTRMENWKVGEMHGAFEVVQSLEAADAQIASSITKAAGLVAVLILVGSTIFYLVMTKSVIKPIDRIVSGLNESADQVNDAAGQVSSSSQRLAEGATGQASSVAQTSAALTRMAAVTRTNAENARRANELTDKARAAAESGNKTMGQLDTAMTAINESSGKISKIIKVIEEIAFQTNLLALNAAVEAARAGEHGKGFAVVADEVRNLARRAAQAAEETTGLIEDSVNRAKEGADVASEVGEALGAIVTDVTAVAELVSGITQASEDQAEEVDRVNATVSDMDKVTQENAAGAEESASASEQLSAQAATVQGTVDELAALIGARRRAPLGRAAVGDAVPGGIDCGSNVGHSDDFMSTDDGNAERF